MAVSASGGLEQADIVTMRGEGVAAAGGVGNMSGTGAAVDNNGSGVHGASQCHPNGTPNGEPQWRPAPQDASKMAKIRDVVENAAR